MGVGRGRTFLSSSLEDEVGDHLESGAAEGCLENAPL